MNINKCIVVGICSSYPSSSSVWIQQGRKKLCIAVIVGQCKKPSVYSGFYVLLTESIYW